MTITFICTPTQLSMAETIGSVKVADVTLAILRPPSFKSLGIIFDPKPIYECCL